MFFLTQIEAMHCGTCSHLHENKSIFKNTVRVGGPGLFFFILQQLLYFFFYTNMI